MGFWGFDSVSDAFDGGGRGGSGSEHSFKDHDDYKEDYEEKIDGVEDPLARSHASDDSVPRQVL